MRPIRQAKHNDPKKKIQFLYCREYFLQTKQDGKSWKILHQNPEK